MSVLLEVEDLQTAYGPGQVLFGISLRVGAGEVATLLGRNGMGKSTTLRCLCGWMAPTAGRIRFCGEDVTGWSADRIARLGLGLVLHLGLRHLVQRLLGNTYKESGD